MGKRLRGWYRRLGEDDFKLDLKYSSFYLAQNVIQYLAAVNTVLNPVVL